MNSAAIQDVIVFCQENLRRAAWTALLEKQPGISAVRTASTISDLKTLSISKSQASIFVDITDLNTPLVAQLKSAVPDSGLLILGSDFEIEEAVSFLQAGATGLLSREASVAELTRAIIAVGRGEIVLPPEMASKVMLALARGEVKPKSTIEPLTDREQEVLALLAQGLTNKDIAQSLFLSVRTIEAHLRNIYDKLDVNSRTEAVLWAVQHGYEP